MLEEVTEDGHNVSIHDVEVNSALSDDDREGQAEVAPHKSR
jgi:hypothetical protein